MPAVAPIVLAVVAGVALAVVVTGLIRFKKRQKAQREKSSSSCPTPPASRFAQSPDTGGDVKHLGKFSSTKRRGNGGKGEASDSPGTSATSDGHDAVPLSVPGTVDVAEILHASGTSDLALSHSERQGQGSAGNDNTRNSTPTVNIYNVYYKCNVGKRIGNTNNEIKNAGNVCLEGQQNVFRDQREDLSGDSDFGSQDSSIDEDI